MITHIPPVVLRQQIQRVPKHVGQQVLPELLIHTNLLVQQKMVLIAAHHESLVAVRVLGTRGAVYWDFAGVAVGYVAHEFVPFGSEDEKDDDAYLRLRGIRVALTARIKTHRA